MYDGAAHPGNALDVTRVTYDLLTGKAVTAKDVFAKFPDALVKK